MNIVQEEKRRVVSKAPSVAGPRRRRAHSIPRWAYLLFAVLAVVVLLRTVQRGVSTLKPPQVPARPVTVAKVVTKDVPVYLDEIGTCAAYETVQVQAQVSGQILTRDFQDGADVKKGDLLFTIDPRPFQATLDQAKAQAALDQVTLKRQEDLRASAHGPFLFEFGLGRRTGRELVCGRRPRHRHLSCRCLATGPPAARPAAN